MNNEFSKKMEEKFMRELQQINLDSQSQIQDSYYEKQKRQLQFRIQQIKNQKNIQNPILHKLRSNFKRDQEQMNNFEEQIKELKQINLTNNRFDPQKIKNIKQKIASDNTSVIKLADQQYKKQYINTNQIGLNIHKAQTTVQTLQDNSMLVKMQSANIEREVVLMGIEDQLSMKYQKYILSEFFKQRFIQIKLPKIKEETKILPIQISKPTTTYTKLRPLANTEKNVLPKNAPQIALRALKKSKKITLKPISQKTIQIKLTKVKNPQQVQNKQKAKIQSKISGQQQYIKQYIKSVNIKQLQKISKRYKPKQIKSFFTEKESAINTEIRQQKKSLQIIECKSEQHLKEFKMTFQGLSDLKGIQTYQMLEYVELQYNKLNHISNIGQCKNIIQLNLSNNKINDITALNKLKWLRFLDLSQNELTKIEFKGGSLEIIDFGHNKIDKIIDFTSNTYLRVIRGSGNKIKEIGNMNNLYFLQEIDLSNNRLQNIKGIEGCYMLERLQLQNNNIQILYGEFPFIFLYLNILNLNKNRLSQLPCIILPSLQRLYIQQNKLSKQSKYTIYLPQLQQLNINNNSLTGFALVWSIIRYSRKLKSIYYSNNQYFLFLREHIKQIYQAIIYCNMHYLQILNEHPYNIGLKKYYQKVLQKYCKNISIFEIESPILYQINLKTLCSLRQRHIANIIEKDRRQFYYTNQFLVYRSIKQTQNLIELQHKINNKSNILLHNYGLPYFHDQYYIYRRKMMHRINTFAIRWKYKRNKKLKYLKNNYQKIVQLLSFLKNHINKTNLQQIIHQFHSNTKGLNQLEAAIKIQKTWKMYKTRKRYKNIIKSLKTQQEQLQAVNETQFDNYEPLQFNLVIPQNISFDAYVIKPQVFKEIAKKQQNSKVQNSKVKINNYIEENSSDKKPGKLAGIKEEKPQIFMGIEVHNQQCQKAIMMKNKLKQKKAQKEAQKTLTATQRYNKLMKK